MRPNIRCKDRIFTALIVGLLWSFIVFKPVNGFGQPIETEEETERLGVLPVPTFGYAPETNFYVGAATLLTYRFKEQRLSNATIEFTYTLNKQSIISLDYFLFPNKYLAIRGEWSRKNFPDLYWSIASPWQEGEAYTLQSFAGNTSLLYVNQANRAIMLGPYFEYRRLNVSEYLDRGILDYEVSSKDLSFFALGADLIYDSRDQVLTPSKGTYFLLRYKRFSNVASAVELDSRYYKNIKNKLVVAGQFISRLSDISEQLQLDKYGNSMFLRGYYEGNFRASNAMAAQIELRFPVIGRFGLATFGGLARVGHTGMNYGLYTYGGGLRFKIDRQSNVNIRFDYALGRQNSGFYIGFGEAF